MREGNRRARLIIRQGGWIWLGLVPALLSACVRTSLDVPPDHPANSSAPTLPIPSTGRALRDGFDPDELAGAQPTAPPAENTAAPPSGHEGMPHGESLPGGANDSRAQPMHHPGMAPMPTMPPESGKPGDAR